MFAKVFLESSLVARAVSLGDNAGRSYLRQGIVCIRRSVLKKREGSFVLGRFLR